MWKGSQLHICSIVYVRRSDAASATGGMTVLTHASPNIPRGVRRLRGPSFMCSPAQSISPLLLPSLLPLPPPPLPLYNSAQRRTNGKSLYKPIACSHTHKCLPSLPLFSPPRLCTNFCHSFLCADLYEKEGGGRRRRVGVRDGE